MSSLQMEVEGMTCERCNVAVESALERVGAVAVKADFRLSRVELRYEGDHGVLRDALHTLGYTPGKIAVFDPERSCRPASARGDDYDVVAIGAGSAAFAAAARATSLGARAAIVERNTVGGTCVNVGSKSLLAASEAYRRAADHPFAGISTFQGGVDMAALIGMKADVVTSLRREKYLDLAEEHGFDVIHGNARFSGPESIDVDGREIRAGHFLICTGSAPWTPPIEGLEDAGYLTSTSAMELKELPDSLVVIGGNYIGLEIGQVFANLGSRVTIIEARDRITPLEEPELSDGLTRALVEQGIEVVTSAKVSRVEGGETKFVIAEADGTQRRFGAREILVATGRRPALDGLELENAGIDRDERGNIVLDAALRTTNPRVLAAGDVTGAPQFVHVAAAQGAVAAENAVCNTSRRIDYAALPRVTFTTPNVAAVGLTAEQARAEGYECDCRLLELEHVPRPIVSLDTRGAFKIVAERGTGKLLGMHVVAPNAGDVILAGVYAVKFGLTVQDLADTWAPYLTMAEGIRLTAQTFACNVTMLSCSAA